MKSFYSFFEQAEDSASKEPERLSNSLVTTFGRHNPPHIGHKLTLDKAHDVAMNENADQRFYTSQSQDRKKNPLPKDMKIDFMCGEDRRQGMEDLLRKYNGQLYDFDNIYSHSAGNRDELGVDDDPIAKISASKQRNAAQNDDFDGFMEGILTHKGFGEEDAKELFNAVKMFGMKNEEVTVDELRDLYRDGQLYRVGDVVESLTTGLIGEIHRCGANHLICVSEDGIMFKSLIHDVQSI